MQQYRRLRDDFRAIGIARMLPGSEAGLGESQLLLELFAGYFRKRFVLLVIEGIDALVGH
jgi:hypothetical protein